MNVDRLRAVQTEERDADSLRPLPDAFYREVADYIEELRAARAEVAEAAEDPFGDEEVRRLTDEIETAEEVAEAIYERRVGKLVKRASLAAAGMPVDEDGLTAEESELFADLVAEIEAHREEVFATFGAGGERGIAVDRAGGPGAAPREESGGSSGPDQASAPPEPDDESRISPADAGTGDETPATSDRAPEPADGDPPGSTDGGDPDGPTERVTLRITRDVGEVFGVDERVYDLAAEDVVTLPAANARPLLDRDAAEQID